MRRPVNGAVYLAVGFLLCGGATGVAAEGIVDISQERAQAGNVTPEDKAGFPVTISEPGSYRLTSNLTVPDAQTDAVIVAAPNVTLDLAGFAILGPTACTNKIPVKCEPAGKGRGIFSQAVNVTVMNGTVRGMGFDGLSLGTQARVERVRVLSNGHNGIFVGWGSTVANNTVAYNGGAGIGAQPDSVVIGNTVSTNAAVGLGLALNTGFVSNVLANNNGEADLRQMSGGLQIGPNVCGTDNLCP